MTQPAQHTDVAAYALGVLDEADSARFEEHLADCLRCAAGLEDFMGLSPLLADIKEATPDPEVLSVRPGPRVLDRLLGEVTSARRTSRTRRLWLVAAAAALIVSGPLVGLALSQQDAGGHSSVSAARQMYDDGEKVSAVDPATKVDASVSLQSKPWGTHVALKLGNVKGPLKCDLIAVGKDGEEETVTTWAVPEGGYGVPGGSDKWNKEPLYTHGGAAMNRDEIARFDVRTLDGKHLASVKV
ncbi:zf-HC2 domain-containing protein [Streptomyces sp. NPDC050610]|uniref:zf-HC2 domain-containing protein n=1 Tax=Streptomyces sp. NPDC050610 TaxID=3157097 RepID=UPI0034154B38